jgi:hypothetical protein
MPETQHTPGPWRLTYGMGAQRNGSTHLATVRGLGTLATFTNPLNHADAYLIAAAPELLEQLQRMLTIAECSGNNKKTYAEAFRLTREVIKKAKGA